MESKNNLLLGQERTQERIEQVRVNPHMIAPKSIGERELDTNLTNQTLTSPVINTGLSGTAIVDEDTMVSNSDTKVPTQQSVKAYVDANKGKILQVGSAIDSSAISTTSGSFIDMTSMTVTLTVALNSRLIVQATAGLSHATTAGSRIGFQIDIDGAQYGTQYPSGGRADTGGNATVGSIVYRTGALAAGSKTVKIRWNSVDSGTVYATQKALIVMEESA